MVEPAGFVCAGCGARLGPDDPAPFRCPVATAGDGIDHLLRATPFPPAVAPSDDGDPHPFIRHRAFLSAHRLAIGHGLGEDGWAELVGELDARVRDIDGRGFVATPFARADTLSDALGFEGPGGVWVKDETNGVAGSHKARHLFGILLYLEVARRVGLADRRGSEADLAIASCGNAALAAAVVARAGGRRLRVFVPTWADPAIADLVRALGAEIVPCARTPGVAGDPAYRAMRTAVDAGAVPFTCQGTENGLALEGGMTVGLEMADADGDADRRPLDRVFVQVGGGALAASTIRALGAAGVGAPASGDTAVAMPRIHAVQTEGCHPVERAHRLVTALPQPDVTARMAAARRDRGSFMWPWETEPASAATGILDDETYDWAETVEGMLVSGGGPLVVSEAEIRDANDLGVASTGVGADETGTAGLAGLIRARRDGLVDPGERVAVLFTGRRRPA